MAKMSTLPPLSGTSRKNSPLLVTDQVSARLHRFNR